MNLRFKRIAALILITAVSLSSAVISKAAVQAPEKIRIGIANNSGALPVFTVSAEKGLILGMSSGNAFTALYEEATSNKVTIRKDAYYTYVNSAFLEYVPGQASISIGEKLGPYHIKISDSLSNLAEAKQKIESLKQLGVAAYPAYTDAWQVWTGFYTDQSSAQSDITNNIEKKLGKGNFQIIQPSTNRIVAVTSSGSTALIFGSATGVFQIRPKLDNNPYSFNLSNGRKYRGDLEVRRFSGSDMTLINILPFEQYLYGVVPSEIQSSSHQEAIKAQAVTARTYALNNIGKHDNLNFELCSTTDCQVYKGLSEETASTNKAVDDTRGKLVMYNGKPAAVFFFSSSGGMTESNKNVWGYDYPYLQSVEDPYESGNSYNYIWEKTYTVDKIKEIMTQKGFDLGNILNIQVTKRSEAGRATELIITGSKIINGVSTQKTYLRSGTREVFSLSSQWYYITTDTDVSVKTSDLQNVTTMNLGGKYIATAGGVKTLSPSSSLTVVGKDGANKVIPSAPTTYKFTGRGWGHAIGMSQEGARGMANAGFKYDQILMHYFPGTQVQ